MIKFLHQLIERHFLFSEPTDEPAQGCQTPIELLDILRSLRQLHSFNSTNLLRVCLYASARHQEAEQLAGWHAEGALGGIELDSEPPKVHERLPKVIEQASALFCLDDNIIYIHLHIFAHLIM